ncbi:MAG TPA: B-box zinc finger protein [Opitutaceae bacterium]|jgi:hypothetical protein
MTVGTDLPCPRCGRRLDALCWQDAERGQCRACLADFTFKALPALVQTTEVAAAEASVIGQEATCFFHPENRAAAVCESCGRFLCPICVVEEGKRKLCPRCVALTRKAGTDLAGLGDRTLWDSIALTLAAAPLLIYPLIFVTAPVSLGTAIYGWTQPCSAVRGRKWKLVAAMTLAVLEIAAIGLGLAHLIKASSQLKSHSSYYYKAQPNYTPP